ncbi:unnamed protein product [Anisakis simplex]|uniref:Ricin B-type lectin domain-containing protein n=1 Tax=Anisakis simplex TaxID=6269 RepID=A0A158PP16_ANISI|nr:unnamed protein product [Anisakis simplex]
MLEHLVAWVLNNYVGEYLENLNTVQLSIALLQGQVELENIPLKKTALRKLDVPLQVKAGVLGKLTLSVPLAHIRSEPWVIKMSDLLVLVGPIKNAKYDVELVEVYEQSKREQQLEDLEKFHKKQLLLNAGLSTDDDRAQQSWWGASLVSAVVNNIQVHRFLFKRFQLIMTNVHIRYEDGTTFGDTPLCCGLRIHKVSVQTTDSNWKSVYMQPQEGTNVFKKLEIVGLSVYWNPGQKLSPENISHEDLLLLMAPEVNADTTYILQPFCASMCMEKNTSKFPLKWQHPAVPRFKFDIQSEQVAIELSKRQMAEIRLLSREWARYDRARQHRKWRPLVSVGGNAGEWWRFAYNRVRDETEQQKTRHTWNFALMRARHLNAYCRAYRRKLLAHVETAKSKAVRASRSPSATTPTTAMSKSSSEHVSTSSLSSSQQTTASLLSPTSEDVILMKQIERDADYTYHELQLFRETVFRRIWDERETERTATTNESGIQSDDETLDNVESLMQLNTSEDDLRTAKAKNSEELRQNSVEEQQSEGSYGWLSSWFSASQPQVIQRSGDNDSTKADATDSGSSDSVLGTRLKQVEKQLEDEIMDVLSESWDDSTVLRRDVLLAATSLQLENMTVRFVENVDDGSCVDGGTKVLSLDLRQVVSKMHLSPRQHSTAISLSVGDLSVQRLYTASDSEQFVDVPSEPSTETEYESLMFGFGGGAFKDNTQILFAIGKTKASNDGSTANAASESDTSNNIIRKPLFQMRYRRHAPKLVVKHTLEANFSALSLMYEAGAFDGLSNFFNTDTVIFDQKNGEFNVPEVVVIPRIFVKIRVPEVHIEMRKRNSLMNEGNKSPFAFGIVKQLTLGITSTELYLTKVYLSMGSFEVKDLFESNGDSLLKMHDPTNVLHGMKSLSSSCPSLTDATQDSTDFELTRTISKQLLCSLSFYARFITSSRLGSKPGRSKANVDETSEGTGSRKSSRIKRHRKRTHPSETFACADEMNSVMIDFTVVNNKHPLFESLYQKTKLSFDGGSKMNCTVDARFADVIVGMNRRSWTMLFDFFGFLGRLPNENDYSLALSKKLSSTSIVHNETLTETNTSKRNATSDDFYALKLCLYASVLRIHMNYTANKTRLGVLQAVEPTVAVEMRIGCEDEPLRATISFSSVLLSDTTPFYSSLYGERLVVQSNNDFEDDRSSQKCKSSTTDLHDQPKVTVDIIKYYPSDPQLKRDYDMRFRVSVPKKMNVAYVHTHRYMCALLDFWLQFFELQDQVIKSRKPPNDLQADGHGSRVQMDVDVECSSTIILPLSQLCDQAIVCETESFHVNNQFKFADSIVLFTEYSIETQCGIDSQKVGEHLFNTFHFVRSKKNVVSSLYDLTVHVFRNLDGVFSHRVPDLSIITELSNIELKFTSDFYRLLRGFLEKNLGDALVPVPENIPIEILQKPIISCEVGSSNKYATFSLRINFRDVQLNCLVPSTELKKKFEGFATMKLIRSRISFDCFVDNQSELDLICENIELLDSRSDDVERNENVFKTILCSRATNTANSAQLMAEAHLMIKKDEAPVVTLVLLNARVLLIVDWLNDAKNFILLNAADTGSSESLRQPLGISLREGRFDSSESNEQTVTLKITLRESDLILLESPHCKDSLALVAHCTAVLNMGDPHGLLVANLEIQQINIDWCTMSSEEESRCQLTNDFSATLVLSGESEMLVTEQTRTVLSDSSSAAFTKHRLTIGINDVVARFSYRDALVIKNVLQCSLKRLMNSMQHSVIPKNTTESGQKEGAQVNVVRILVKSHQASFWFVDDFQGTAFPLVRFIIKKLSVEKHLEQITSSFIFAIDYFNERLFGWEPLLEPWHIQQFLISYRQNKTAVELHAEEQSTLNINITQAFVQQALHFKSRWSEIKQSFDSNFRNASICSRSDHLPYLLRNETGSNLKFTTAVEEVLEARAKQRKSVAKWISVPAGSMHTFEFPTKKLVLMEYSDEPRQLIIRVDGWDETSPVNVESVGTYFRVARYCSTKTATPSDSSVIALSNARLVVDVSVDKDGRKVVVVRSAVTIVNRLPDAVLVILDNRKVEYHSSGTAMFRIEPGHAFLVPLEFANAQICVKPEGMVDVRAQLIDWHKVKNAGEVVNDAICFGTALKQSLYWICTSVKREHYPEYETLPGHTIVFMPPLTLLNLLPTDAEFILSGITYAVGAGQQLHITKVCLILCEWEEAILNQKASVSESHRLKIRMRDTCGRLLDMYLSVSVGRGGAVSLSFWVPYWFVNSSGIPLIIKQEAAEFIAAGQFEEHERAKDRHPLMFSFSDDNCPKQCIIRAGNNFTKDKGYKPEFSRKFALTVGVHALKLFLTHEHASTRIYNVGVEVRQGTGRYKDTQVVLLTPRYVLNNETSYGLSLSHVDRVNQSSEHVKMMSGDSIIWHENFEDNRMLCVKRDDVKHWSCAFKIDKISSFHITMRDADETPQFVRVEIILNGAVFCVTFTDARYFPPPIQLENVTDVPVLYYQKNDRPGKNYLRTICKAHSTVDYAWDDLYGCKMLILQVYENKCNCYDPQKPGLGPSLIYENNVYIKLAHSFNKYVSHLHLKGKVVLNKLNVSDSSRNQLWRFTDDGCLENIGMNIRAKAGERYVLDVLDKGGFMLMMLKRNTARDLYQKWDGMFVEGRRSEVLLAMPNAHSSLNENGVPSEQIWELQTQRPGSGVLNVECLHRGPTLVIRITDQASCSSQSVNYAAVECYSSTSSRRQRDQKSTSNDFEMDISIRNGIGISLINSHREELIYARFHGVLLHANRRERTYQITSTVELIQIDNQLLSTEHWQVLYCQQNALTGDPDPEDRMIMRPALKLEMNCTPFEHYDAFDCFRIKMCDMSVQLDELLMWKMIQFIQESEAADSVQPNALLQPPNLSLTLTVPTKARRCYFGTLDLEMGTVALSGIVCNNPIFYATLEVLVVTVPKSGLPPELRKLRRQFNINRGGRKEASETKWPDGDKKSRRALARRSSRQKSREANCPGLEEFLGGGEIEQKVDERNSRGPLFAAELKNQTLNIIVTMDAFGNPMGLASDLKESFEGLFFEGDLGGFVSGLGYGVTNSISKVASSMAHGVGTFTFDEQHELMRRRMLRCQPQTDSNSNNALAHLYSGVKEAFKGLGVGVFGGLTAIVTNTYTESKRDGITGALRGFTTGAVDTVTKPVQGIFDLVEGTASAVKEIVGGSAARKSHFADKRIRLSRVCTNLQSLLPCYSSELAVAQMDLVRINGFSTGEVLLDVEVVSDRYTSEGHIRQYVLICSEQCYVIKQKDDEPSNVVQRIPYKHLKIMQPVAVSEHNATFASIGLKISAFNEIILEMSNSVRHRLPHLWCNHIDIAKRLCEKVARAKQLYDHSKRTLSVVEDYDVV